MNKAILDKEVQDYLRAHLATSPTDLALSKSPFPLVSASELAGQLDGLKRSQKKLPLWFDTPGIYFPSLLAMEQASSDLTARYKSTLIAHESTLIDLTGGFGVDSYYFSKRAKKVVHCEQNKELAPIAKHNHRLLGAEHIEVINGDGLAYLATTTQKFDVAYIDPSRRVKQQKVFRLQDCEPDILQHLPLLLSKVGQIIIKAAPLLDIKGALAVLPFVSDVHILSVQNECKEVLFVLNPTFQGTVHFHGTILKSDSTAAITFTMAQEQTCIPTYDLPRKYLYEPDAALLKAGCFKFIACHYTLAKLHPHTHLYTADYLNETFMGRRFEITKVQTYADFKKNKTPIQANVATRNFPLKPEQLKKQHKMKDGGADYLFFCTGPQSELLVVFCKKIKA